MKTLETLRINDGQPSSAEVFAAAIEKEKDTLSQRLNRGLPIIKQRFDQIVPESRLPRNKPQIENGLLVLAFHYYAEMLIEDIKKRNFTICIVYREDFKDIASRNGVIMDFRAIRDLHMSVEIAVENSNELLVKLLEMTREVVEQMNDQYTTSSI